MKPSDKILIKDFRFGIELESNLGLQSVNNNLKFESGWTAHGEHCGSEIVSPILHGYVGLMSVRRQLRNLWKWKDKIGFRHCGLHVHIDIQDFNLGQAKRLVLIASRFDETIFCLMHGCRWKNTYTRRCNYKEKSIKTIYSLYQLQELQADGDRYAGLNLHAFSKHGTVEFRYAMGSADWQKIYSLISLYLRMVGAAKLDIEIPETNPLGILGPLKKTKKNLKILEKNKDAFFDFLQTKGYVRGCLEKMFTTNVFDTTSANAMTSEQITEEKGKIKFSLKKD